MTLKPRSLPPAHKNQLFMPVKCIGFFDDEQTPAIFRHQEVARKRFKPKPAGVFAPSSHTVHEEHDDFNDRELASSKTSMTSRIHVRGHASSAADLEEVNVQLEPTPRKSPVPGRDGEPSTSLLTEDAMSSRTYDSRLLSASGFYPVLDCSKYTVIGEPKFRKKRVKRRDWTLPKIASATPDLMASCEDHHPKTNSIDLRSIYGSSSKVQQVPHGIGKEDTVILPPLEIGRRRQEAEASVDPNSLAEKRLVMKSRPRNIYRRMARDQVVLPSAYRPYFRFPNRQRRFVQSVFSSEDMWQNNSQPVHCVRCANQSLATLHYCDVLGKRFCHFCSEMTDRAFSHAYENNRLLAPSPSKSPTLQMLKEESFIGVRKVVITKTAKETPEKGHADSHKHQV